MHHAILWNNPETFISNGGKKTQRTREKKAERKQDETNHLNIHLENCDCFPLLRLLKSNSCQVQNHFIQLPSGNNRLNVTIWICNKFNGIFVTFVYGFNFITSRCCFNTLDIRRWFESVWYSCSTKCSTIYLTRYHWHNSNEAESNWCRKCIALLGLKHFVIFVAYAGSEGI